MDGIVVLVLFATWVGLACGVGAIAVQRGKDRGTWTMIALFISPLIAILFLMASPTSASGPTTQPGESQRVKCSECAELILPEAKVCRFCGAKREPQVAQPAPVEQAVGSEHIVSGEPQRAPIAVTLFAIAGFLFCVGIIVFTVLSR
jgi:hypothetical protein